MRVHNCKKRTTFTDGTFNTAEAAFRLGLTEDVVRKLAKKGIIDSVKKGRDYVFNDHCIDSFKDRNTGNFLPGIVFKATEKAVATDNYSFADRVVKNCDKTLFLSWILSHKLDAEKTWKEYCDFVDSAIRQRLKSCKSC